VCSSDLGPTCEAMGLLKMDFLGLRTLSIIERCCQLIRESLCDDKVWDAVGRSADDCGPHPLDLDRLNCDDARVFDLFQRGDGLGRADAVRQAQKAPDGHR